MVNQYLENYGYILLIKLQSKKIREINLNLCIGRKKLSLF